jgi:putative DNA primase/helicase
MLPVKQESIRLRFLFSQNDLPVIDIIEKNLPVLTQQALDALMNANYPPYLFRYGNNLVRLVTGENDQLHLDILNKSKLRHELARCAIFRIYRRKQWEVDLPPIYVIDDILAHPNPPFPVISRILTAPIFSEEGKIQTKSGYSPVTGYYLRIQDGTKVSAVPENPQEDHIRRAKEIIDELLFDFPFIDKSEKAHATCLFLSPFVRPMITGFEPVFVIEAPSPGTGKTLLAQALAYPSTGRLLEAMSEGRNDEEMRKRITAKLIKSPTHVFIDNVRHQIAYSSLASAITAGIWEDRILGGSRTVQVPVTSTWVITGNNPSLSSEMARRCVRIRLDTGREQPWLRNPSEFKHQNLIEWTRKNRGQLIWAALVLVQNWIAKNRPRPTGNPTMGMFEEWCNTMGGILEINNIPGFLLNINDVYTDSDVEIAVWRSLTEAWWQTFGKDMVGAAELHDLVVRKDIPLELGSGSDRSQKIRLGIQISKMRQRQFGQYRIIFANKRNHAQNWRLEPVL